MEQSLVLEDGTLTLSHMPGMTMRMVVVKMSQVNQTDLPPGRARMQQQKGPCVLSAMENFFTLKATLSYPHKPSHHWAGLPLKHSTEK